MSLTSPPPAAPRSVAPRTPTKVGRATKGPRVPSDDPKSPFSPQSSRGGSGTLFGPSSIPVNRLRERAGPSSGAAKDVSPNPGADRALLAGHLDSGLALPPHYANLLALHSALEHALLLHLSTAGLSTASAVSTASSGDGFDDGSSRNTVRLENIISYKALRPSVELSSGKRFGPQEFARLVWIWAGGDGGIASSSDRPSSLGGDAEANGDGAERTPEEIKGLGFLVTRTRCLDMTATASGGGRKAWTWGLGIEFELCRPAPAAEAQANLEMNYLVAGPRTIGSPGGASKTPPSSPSRAQIRKQHAREGMSIVALWSNGSEARKAEVSRRILDRVAREHQAFVKRLGAPASAKSSAVETVPSTPSSNRRRSGLVLGDLPTPPSTNRTGGRVASRPVSDEDVASPTTSPPSTPSERGAVRTLRNTDLAAFNDRPDIPPTPPATKHRAEKKGGLPDFILSAFSLDQHRSDLDPLESKGLPASWHPSFDLSSLPPLPQARLPCIDASVLLAKNRPVSALGLSPRKRKIAQLGAIAEDREEATAAMMGGGLGSPAFIETTNETTTEGRKMSLMERIKAKEQARRAGLQRPSPLLSSTSSSLGDASANGMDAIRRRSMLSRLSDVADAVYMLFTAVPPSSSSTTATNSSPRKAPRRCALPLSEVLASIVKSSKITLSLAEAEDALRLLDRLCPGFARVKRIEKGGEWVMMEGVAAVGASGSGFGEKEGGRMGLKEVRERIRRELSAA